MLHLTKRQEHETWLSPGIQMLSSGLGSSARVHPGRFHFPTVFLSVLVPGRPRLTPSLSSVISCPTFLTEFSEFSELVDWLNLSHEQSPPLCTRTIPMGGKMGLSLTMAQEGKFSSTPTTRRGGHCSRSCQCLVLTPWPFPRQWMLTQFPTVHTYISLPEDFLPPPEPTYAH